MVRVDALVLVTATDEPPAWWKAADREHDAGDGRCVEHLR